MSFLKADFLKFLTWCEDNDMKPNIPKTKTMFISSKQGVNKIMADPPDLEVAGEQLHVSENEKLLGIHLDNTSPGHLMLKQ